MYKIRPLGGNAHCCELCESREEGSLLLEAREIFIEMVKKMTIEEAAEEVSEKLGLTAEQVKKIRRNLRYGLAPFAIVEVAPSGATSGESAFARALDSGEYEAAYYRWSLARTGGCPYKLVDGNKVTYTSVDLQSLRDRRVRHNNMMSLVDD